MTDDEINGAVRAICNSSKSDEEVKDRLRYELDYYQGAEVVTAIDDSGRFTMAVQSPRGNLIDI